MTISNILVLICPIMSQTDGKNRTTASSNSKHAKRVKKSNKYIFFLLQDTETCGSVAIITRVALDESS